MPSVTLTAATGPPGEIDLSWTTDKPNVSYKIQSSYNGINFFTIAIVQPGTTTYSDTGLYYSTLYSYRLVGLNAPGGTQRSNIASTYTQAALPNPYPIFADSLNSRAINPAWSFVGGRWKQSNGMLQQLITRRPFENRKAILTDQSYPSDQAITAKVSVTDWAAGDAAPPESGFTPTPGRARATSWCYTGITRSNSSTTA